MRQSKFELKSQVKSFTSTIFSRSTALYLSFVSLQSPSAKEQATEKKSSGHWKQADHQKPKTRKTPAG